MFFFLSKGDPQNGWFVREHAIYKVVPPQLCLLVYNPNNYRYNPLINPCEIVLINQLNANDLGHHLVEMDDD